MKYRRQNVNVLLVCKDVRAQGDVYKII